VHHARPKECPIRTLGAAKVAIKNGFVVSAKDPLGSSWRAEDVQKSSKYPRLLSHIFVLAVALPPLTMTVAQAHQAPVPHQRIVLDAAVSVRPETLRDIPADAPSPPPAPAPTPPPAPKPKPRPVVFYATGAVADIIRAAAAKWGADPNQLLRVASCESGLNPNSYNSRSGATGLFQFKPGTFYGHGGHNIWDAADQADVAAHMFSQGLAYEWSCK
jgi:soluble lytic murein transglycosylase-like protein